MNKKFSIIGGVAVILLLLGIWAYLLVYGAPAATTDIFANLGTEGEVTEGEVIVPPAVVEETPLVNVNASRLRQLTTGPVAGFREVQLSTTTPALLYYVEMGTGHVYTINTDSGENVRVSATTFPQTVSAEISHNGQYYAMRSASASKAAPLYVGALATSTVSITNLYGGTASAMAFNSNNELYILNRNADTSSAITYNPKSNSSTPLFSLPFLEATIDWGKDRGDSHLVYPKPATALEGQLYEVSGDTLTRLPVQGLGITALKNGDIVLYNAVDSNRLSSYFYISSLKVTYPLDSPILVEKCVGGLELGTFICAQDGSQTNLPNQDDWYTGEQTFSDSVWLLDGNTFSGELLFNAAEESGRELDIIKLDLNSTGEVLYFINKLDNTLWMYEL